jgi:hypothetical protein
MIWVTVAAVWLMIPAAMAVLVYTEDALDSEV